MSQKIDTRMSAMRLACAMGMAAVGFVATAVAAQAIPGELPVTGQRDLLDFEFSQSRQKIVWADWDGCLWIAGVDPATGMFVPVNGKGTLLDADAMAASDLPTLGNGPEWISTSTGDQIVYTRFLAGMPRTRGNARLALAQQLRDGSWRAGFLAPSQAMRAVPYASRDWRDPQPRISYVDPQGNHYWRNLDDPASETRVVGYPASQYFFSLRFAEGSRLSNYPRLVDGTWQVFGYDLDDGVETQLAFDSGQKDLNSRAWIWQAPEFGGDKAMFTVADNTELRIYRETATHSGWAMVRSIRTPLGGIINSPEYFVYQGASYVFFVASVPPAAFPSQVYVANIDAEHPQLLQLTPDLPRRMRTDPEVFIADDGPWIYFNRQTTDETGNQYCLSCNEGVFRAYTGLTPAE